jgi:hypothetical protein
MSSSFRQLLPIVVMVWVLLLAGSLLNIFTVFGTRNYGLLVFNTLLLATFAALTLATQQRERHRLRSLVIWGIAMALSVATAAVATIQFVQFLQGPIR